MFQWLLFFCCVFLYSFVKLFLSFTVVSFPAITICWPTDPYWHQDCIVVIFPFTQRCPSSSIISVCIDFAVPGVAIMWSMTVFSSVFLLLTLVQFPESEFRLAATRLLFSTISFNNLPFLDYCLLQSILFTTSFALKSPVIIMSLLAAFGVIWLLRVVYIPLTSPIFAFSSGPCYIFGLPSILIHLVFSCLCSSPLESSVVFSDIFFWDQDPYSSSWVFNFGLSVHLYPLIDMCSPFFSIVSVIRAIVIFSICSWDLRLLIVPFILMVTMAISLFFLIFFYVFLFVFCWWGFRWVFIITHWHWFLVGVFEVEDVLANIRLC